MNYANNLTASQAQTIPSAPQRLPEVTGQVERMGYGLELLGKVVEELELRLDAVLARRSEQGGTGNASAPEPVRVVLAEQLNARNAAIEHITTSLRGIIERIEL